ncbi:hypothetical protein ACFL3C_03425 [Patescibacteria group bacterium]
MATPRYTTPPVVPTFGSAATRALEARVQRQYEASKRALKGNIDKQLVKLKKDVSFKTYEARVKAPDRSAITADDYAVNARRFMKEENKPYLAKLASLKKLPPASSEAERQRQLAAIPGKMKALVEQQYKENVAFIQMLRNALKAMSRRGPIRPAQMAAFDSMFRGLSVLHKKKRFNMAGITSRIASNGILQRDWNSICDIVVSNKYQRKIKGAQIEMQATGAVLSLMTFTQRGQLVLELAKRKGKEEAFKLMKALGDTAQLTIIQVQELTKKIDPNRKFGPAEAKKMREQQTKIMKRMRWVAKKRRSGMHINAAARGGFGKWLGTGAAILYSLGAISNYASHLKSGALAGLKNPYFWLCAGTAFVAANYASTTGGTRRGLTPSYVDRMITPSIPEQNYFGKSKLGKDRHDAFKEMAATAGSLPIIDEWLTSKNGTAFNVLSKMYNELQVKKVRRKHGKKPRVTSMYERAVAIQGDVHRSRGGTRKGKGEKLLEKAYKVYGATTMERVLLKMVHASSKLIIQDTNDLYTKRVPGDKRMTFFTYMRRIQGLKVNRPSVRPGART